MTSICRLICIVLALAAAARAEDLSYTRKQDIVYGRKDGVALTLDVIAPKENANGIGIIWVVSGGWFSAHEVIDGAGPLFTKPLIDRGYTIVAVVHGSQPRFTIQDILKDINRSVRFTRTHAKEWNIDPDRIGIYGGSAGGHLSVMQGVAPEAANEKAADPVDKASSKVQCVVAFFPPTDFLNYGGAGVDAMGRGILKDFRGAFDFRELDLKQKRLMPITDERRIEEIAKQISPIYHVDISDAPTLIIHGDADTLVPYQQATSIMEKFKSAHVPAELITKPKAGHGWGDIGKDMQSVGDFFDKHLKNQPATKPTTESTTKPN